MSSALAVDPVEINYKAKRFFGINECSKRYTPTITKMMGGSRSMYHKLTTFSDAQQFILSYFNDYLDDTTSIYVSNSIVTVNQVCDEMNKLIFQTPPFNEGWLVFYDPINNANWAHTCEYWIFKSNTEFIYADNEHWRPNNKYKMVKVF